MASNSTNNGRYTGSFSLGGNPAGQPVGAPAPVAPPPPPVQPSAPQPVVPQPSPAPAGDPFQQDEPRSNPWKFFGVIVIIAAIGFAIFAAVKWGIPALKGNDSNPNPSSQVGSQTPSASDNSGNSGEPSPAPSDNGNTAATVAEQAAAIDPWYSGVPESNWLTKTAAELGGNNGVPLGSFAKHFGVVLADGTVIVRASSENNTKTPTIVSGYSVPPEWRGKALILDKANTGLILATDQIPADLSQSLTIAGDVWQWDSSLNSYGWVTTGTVDTGMFGS